MKRNISISELAPKNIFKVPDGYFDTLSTSIQQRIDAEEEPVLSIGKSQNFNIPEGYFDKLSSRILNRISEEKQRITLDSLEKVNIFTVPKAYFEELEEKTKLNLWVESLEKKNIFEVPENYFKELSGNILQKTTQVKEAKVIKVNWWQKERILWSAAASIVLIIGLWSAIPQFTKSDTDIALEKVSTEEINSYLETQDLSYLEDNATPESVKVSEKDIDAKVLDELKIDRKDILNHLENHSLEEEDI